MCDTNTAWKNNQCSELKEKQRHKNRMKIMYPDCTSLFTGTVGLLYDNTTLCEYTEYVKLT